MTESSVLHRTFYSPSMNKEKKYCIYLPPSYHSRSDLHYSTLYLLPGLMDYELSWVHNGKVHEHMDRLIYHGKIGEMIIVMPDKDDAAVDPRGAEAFTGYLSRDIIGHIDHDYRTIASREHRGIEGLSLGASWAIRMLAYFPHLFKSVGCLSGGFTEEVYKLITEKQDYIRESGIRFRVGAGLAEPDFIPPNEQFVNFIRSLNLYCELDLADGPHDWELWEKQVYNSLQFHYYSFNPQ